MRVKTGVVRHRKHKKILKLAKGYRMARRKRIKVAKESVLHAGEYAFAGRKLRKRNFRKLWIIRINAALKKHNLSYSKFIYLLKKAEIKLNRKILADLALKEPAVFAQIVKNIVSVFAFFAFFT